MESAVVLWTGGKDSYLSLILSRARFRVTALITFVPAGGAEFKAHPQTEIRIQASQLGVPIHFIEVLAPFKEGYIKGIEWIRDQLNARILITGDIDYVNGQPNWIVECCNGLGVEVVMPLWQKDRGWILDELLSRGIRARISYLNHPELPKHWLNKVIDPSLLTEMRTLLDTVAFDLAGENGEYHTMVVDGPGFEAD